MAEDREDYTLQELGPPDTPLNAPISPGKVSNEDAILPKAMPASQQTTNVETQQVQPEQQIIQHTMTIAESDSMMGQTKPQPVLKPSNLIMVDGRLHKIPRPRNAFMIFANENRRAFRDIFPNEANNQISMRLGNAWHNLAADVKARFFERAREEDREHKRKYPFYHYTPALSRRIKDKRTKSVQGSTGPSMPACGILHIPPSANNPGYPRYPPQQPLPADKDWNYQPGGPRPQARGVPMMPYQRHPIDVPPQHWSNADCHPVHGGRDENAVAVANLQKSDTKPFSTATSQGYGINPRDGPAVPINYETLPPQSGPYGTWHSKPGAYQKPSMYRSGCGQYPVVSSPHAMTNLPTIHHGEMRELLDGPQQVYLGKPVMPHPSSSLHTDLNNNALPANNALNVRTSDASGNTERYSDLTPLQFGPQDESSMVATVIAPSYSGTDFQGTYYTSDTSTTTLPTFHYFANPTNANEPAGKSLETLQINASQSGPMQLTEVLDEPKSAMNEHPRDVAANPDETLSYSEAEAPAENTPESGDINVSECEPENMAGPQAMQVVDENREEIDPTEYKITDNNTSPYTQNSLTTLAAVACSATQPSASTVSPVTTTTSPSGHGKNMNQRADDHDDDRLPGMAPGVQVQTITASECISGALHAIFNEGNSTEAITPMSVENISPKHQTVDVTCQERPQPVDLHDNQEEYTHERGAMTNIAKPVARYDSVQCDSAGAPFVYLPCNPTFAASLGWDPSLLPTSKDFYQGKNILHPVKQESNNLLESSGHIQQTHISQQ